MPTGWHEAFFRMENVRIHRAILKDLDDLLPLLEQYRVFYKRAPNAALEQRFLHERLANHDTAIFIARGAEGALGFAQITSSMSSVSLSPTLIIEDLFVDPSARGRGIATALLERAKAHARQHGAPALYLETAHTNRAAQRVYERAGWKIETEFRKYNCPLQVEA